MITQEIQINVPVKCVFDRYGNPFPTLIMWRYKLCQRELVDTVYAVLTSSTPNLCCDTITGGIRDEAHIREALNRLKQRRGVNISLVSEMYPEINVMIRDYVERADIRFTACIDKRKVFFKEFFVGNASFLSEYQSMSARTKNSVVLMENLLAVERLLHKRLDIPMIPDEYK